MQMLACQTLTPFLFINYYLKLIDFPNQPIILSFRYGKYMDVHSVCANAPLYRDYSISLW